MPWVSNHYICWGWGHRSRNQRCLEQRVGREVFLLLTLHLFWVTLPRAVEYVHSLGSGIQAVCRKVTLTKAGFSSSYKSPGCGELYGDIPGCNCSHCVFVGLSSNHKLFQCGLLAVATNSSILACMERITKQKYLLTKYFLQFLLNKVSLKLIDAIKVYFGSIRN